MRLIPGASIVAVVCADAPRRQNKLIPGASITLQPSTPDRRISTSSYGRKPDCPAPDYVDVSGSAGGRAVLPCSYTPTPGQDVAVRWYAFPDQEGPVLLIESKRRSSAPIPAQWSGRVKLSDEVSSGNGSLLISELTLEDTGDYTCDMWVNGICVTHRNVNLTVQDENNPYLLIESNTPSAPIPAKWSGRVKLSDEVSSGNASLLISELTMEDTLDYTCTVLISRECVTHRAVKLTVEGKYNEHVLVANANGNNQNAGDHNASSDLLTYAVIDHTRQPGGAPDRSGVSAVDNTEYATVRIH
ncbi:UNVERIFIED_CONTAM: hypothetical protein FKN15_009835 [Acipenser sinensis]